MTALELLKELRNKIYLPHCCEKKEHRGIPSNSELTRWLNDKAIVINGLTPTAQEEVNFPVTQLIFFPKGKRKTTIY